MTFNEWLRLQTLNGPYAREVRQLMDVDFPDEQPFDQDDNAVQYKPYKEALFATGETRADHLRPLFLAWRRRENHDR